MAESFDAVVIGGGPAGATTAILLARAGWSVALVERSAFPRRKVCGEFVSATSLPLMRLLGVADAFLKRAGPEITHVGLFARHRRITAGMPRLFDERDGWGRAVGREHLDAMLLESAAQVGARIFQPCTASRVQKDPAYVGGAADEHWRVQLEGGATRRETELEARVVIAAHGSWGAGPLPTQPSRRPLRASDLFGFKVHLLNCRLPAGLMPLLAFPGGYGGMVQSDLGRISLSCCIRRDELARCRRRFPASSAGQAVLSHIISSCSAARDLLPHASPESEWRSAGPIRPGIRGTDRDGVFCVGNTAGEAHPVVAEGISMAMQSGWTLARALTGTPDLDAARRAYAVEWHRLFARRIQAAAVIAHWAMRPAAVAVVLPLLDAFPAVLTQGARTSGKVTPLFSLSH